jgi:hypothetical protein
MWVDNIRLDLGEVGWGDVEWIGLAQDRSRWRALVNLVFHEMLRNYRVASRVVLSSIELVNIISIAQQTLEEAVKGPY